MRRLIAAAAFVAASAQAGHKPGVDLFFDEMAIRTAPAQHARWVVGDNVSGYFEAFTHDYDQGAGYVMKSGTWLRNYVTYAGDLANDRTHGAEWVQPYGHLVRYPNGATEELAVLAHRQAIALRATSKSGLRLAIQPLLTDAARASAQVRDGQVIALPGIFMAIAADRPVELDDELLVRAATPTRTLTVVVAFAATAEEAQRNARELAASDPIRAERQQRYEALTRSYLETNDRDYNRALNWAKASSLGFVVEEFGKGIWAGLPWFRDNWGRDSFIALPGTLLVSGHFADAKAVLENFARFQNLKPGKQYGRIPNRVSTGDIIYNTVDGTPWMLREALEYIRYTGDKAFAAQMLKLAVPYFEGAIANYMDADDLLTHDGADTWMDARIEGKQPWSARGPRAVEIQALWYTALQTGAALAREAGDEAKAREWATLAQRVQTSFLKLFWDGSVMADRLRDDGSRDTKVRPNQLMLATIPADDFVPQQVQALVIRNACTALLYPYGVASLSQDDDYFHPRHENPDFYHKDAAYHQGTVWGWNAGFTVTALDKFGYQDLAWQLTRNLGDQILHLGTLGTMSELLDALPPLKPSGTFSQSWSVAEYARNAYQDYVGFRPDLLAGVLSFTPAIPKAWSRFHAELPYGDGERVDVDYARGAWTLTLSASAPRTVKFTYLNPDKSRSQLTFALAPGVPHRFEPAGGTLVQPSQAATIGELRFVTPKHYNPQDFPVTRGKDVLKSIVEHNAYR